MKMRLLTLAALLAAASGAQAHHVWIEQDASGARLFFGEFADNLRETSPGLLDKFVKPRAQLLPVQGEPRELALNRQAAAFVLAARAGSGESLVAQETGYPPFEKKEAGQVISRTLWTPAARWISGFQPLRPQLTLDLVPSGGKGEFTVYYQGKPLPEAQVEVVAQSGWAREAKADAQGRLRVELPWRGLYALEVKHSDKAGIERDGVKADVALYVTTLSFSLADGLPSPPPPPAAEPNK